MRRLLAAALAIAFALIAAPAMAQGGFGNTTGYTVATCGSPPLSYTASTSTQAYPGPFSVDVNGKLCVNATVSASVSGFQPSASGARATPVSVTTADSSGALATGAVDVVTNTGTNPMYCNVNGVAATTSDQEITSGGGWFAFTIPSGVTTLHCIATGGSTTANIVGGSGLPTGTGAGGGGGGSSGAVFGPTAVGSAAANPPVLTGGTADGTATGNVAVWKIVSGIGYLNIAQVNGVTTLAGAGAVGTGSQRVAVGQDTTTIAGSAPGTAGTPSTNVVSVQGVAGGTAQPVSESGTWTVQPGNTANTTAWLFNLGQMGGTNIASGCTAALSGFGTTIPGTVCPVMGTYVLNATPLGPAASAAANPVTIATDQAGTCTLHAFKHITTATDTLAVQGVSAQTIRLCAWKARAAGTATWFWENTASTNANCSSSNTQISGVATEAANTGEVVTLPLGITLNNTSANGLCINSTGTGGVDIDFWYAQR